MEFQTLLNSDVLLKKQSYYVVYCSVKIIKANNTFTYKIFNE